MITQNGEGLKGCRESSRSIMLDTLLVVIFVSFLSAGLLAVVTLKRAFQFLYLFRAIYSVTSETCAS